MKKLIARILRTAAQRLDPPQSTTIYIHGSGPYDRYWLTSTSNTAAR